MSKITIVLAKLLLLSVFLISILAGTLAPKGYERQFRNHLDAPPSAEYLLGTDSLGRDRWSRLLYGTRISLLLAPAAACVTVLIAAIAGMTAGYLGGWTERVLGSAVDLFLSLPWLFVLLSVRALLPLDAPPLVSAGITFLLLGLLGWPSAAQVVRSAMREAIASDYVLLARAQGTSTLRMLFKAVLPNLRPILAAQFWISVPAFLIGEASLGLLGLGVSEPLPSWGGLLRELEETPFLYEAPWLFAPAAMLVLCLMAFQILLAQKEATT